MFCFCLYGVKLTDCHFKINSCVAKKITKEIKNNCFVPLSHPSNEKFWCPDTSNNPIFFAPLFNTAAFTKVFHETWTLSPASEKSQSAKRFSTHGPHVSFV